MKRERWSILDTEIALACAADGVSRADIGIALGRTEDAVRQRLSYLRRSEEMRQRVRERTRAKRALARVQHEARA